MEGVIKPSLANMVSLGFLLVWLGKLALVASQYVIKIDSEG